MTKHFFLLIAYYFLTHAHTQITFIDAARLDENLGAEDERDRLRAAIERIRARPGFYNVPIVLIVENAPGQAGSYLDMHVRASHQPLLTMREVTKQGSSVKRRGVPKTQESTAEMRFIFRELLNEGRVSFDSQLVSLPHTDDNDISGTGKAMEKLFAQMERYVPEIKKKYGESNNDDLLIALMMIPYWRRIFWESVAYSKYRADHIVVGQSTSMI
jgi:hypothetical protein